MKSIKELGIKRAIKFTILSAVQFLMPIFFLPPLRQTLMVLFGAKIGNNSVIMELKFMNLHQKGLSHLSIGNDSFIGDECLFDLYDSIEIGNQVTLGPRVTVLTHTNVGYKDHPLQKLIPKTSKKVSFESGCFIGASSTILQGVTVGSRSVVAAGSVVVTDVKSNSLYGGVPAKFIKKLKNV